MIVSLRGTGGWDSRLHLLDTIAGRPYAPLSASPLAAAFTRSLSSGIGFVRGVEDTAILSDGLAGEPSLYRPIFGGLGRRGRGGLGRAALNPCCHPRVRPLKRRPLVASGGRDEFDDATGEPGGSRPGRSGGVSPYHRPPRRRPVHPLAHGWRSGYAGGTGWETGATMNQQEWLTYTDFPWMVERLCDDLRLTENATGRRKQRLLACACARRSLEFHVRRWAEHRHDRRAVCRWDGIGPGHGSGTALI